MLISILITLFVASEFQAQPQTAKPVLNPNQLAVEWVDRLNALDDWHLSVDGKEEGVDQVVDHMMELFAPDVVAEVPPHDEEQSGPVMLIGNGQVRKWVDKLARSRVQLNYIVKRQTEKEFEGELMVYSKPLPWGGLGISFQIIAAYSLRKDRRRFMEPGAVFIQYREDGKIQRFRLLLAEKDEVIEINGGAR
ncbi:MAG: hypothetical protein DMG14_19710 [Acidobacteria bacterium]|nr:MAG: hypothetical protein DMG14_19710 [Acidobacteriota bacterium]